MEQEQIEWLKWLKELLLDPNRRKQIGCAWPLFFHLLFRVDGQGKWTTNYEQLSQELGLPIPTVKTWRKMLVENQVMKSYMGKHEVTFELLAPFNGVGQLQWDKNDGAQGNLGQARDSRSGVFHDRKPESDCTSIAPIMPLMVDLAQRITKLEMQAEIRRSSKWESGG